MKNPAVIVVLAVLLSQPGMLLAQSSPATAVPPVISVTLAYHEDASGTFEVRDKNGALVTMQDGDEMQLGWTIVTGRGDLAELKVNHTGTIIKIAQNTNFTLAELRSETGGQDVFSLAFGKIRTVAGKASGRDQYQIKTLSAVCGVRGSDIVVEFQEGAFDRLSTLEGTGWIQNADGQAVDVAQGSFADALGTSLEPAPIAPDVLQSLSSEMKFTRLDVSQTMTINKEYQEELAAAPAESGPAKTTVLTSKSGLDGFMRALRDMMGFEIGSLTIGGETWARVVLEPTFKSGNLKAALYLPVIYQNDLFNPKDYYPAGNREWSFGSDQNSPGAAARDFAIDLLLKIKYIEWGQPGDPLYARAGNINDITIGHGLIMRDFANDVDFPSIRRIGVNVSLDFGGFGFQAMVNDLTDPEVFGGRAFIRPVPGFNMTIGLSTVMDINPAKDFVFGPAAAGDPVFINPGLDVEVPFTKGDTFSISAFADAALLLPYFRSVSPFLPAMSSGLASDAVYNSSTGMPFKNWGFGTGLFGNVIIPDLTWRLEFDASSGAFVPRLYGPGYERQRNQLVLTQLSALLNPDAPEFNRQNMGIYGEGGISLDRLFSLKLSYFWPWQTDTSGSLTFAGDDFMVKLVLKKGAIPAVNLSAAIAYERKSFVPSVQHGLSLFDANTVVSTSITYSVTESLDVTLLYTTSAQRDSSGNLIYSSFDAPLPELDTSLSIGMQVHL